jgi:hypothetical protein
MARRMLGPRKQRTREHVIADLSVNHVERFILEEGHTAQRMEKDYGYDVVLSTYDQQGYLEPGSVYLQFKASETLKSSGSDHVFDLDVRDYNLWMYEKMPVVLILFDATSKRASWLDVQGYFAEDLARLPKKGAKTVRVRVPARQVVNRRAVALMRELKWTALGQEIGEEP